MTQDEIYKVSACFAERRRLSPVPQGFIESLQHKPADYELSPKQRAWLLKIWNKLMVD